MRSLILAGAVLLLSSFGVMRADAGVVDGVAVELGFGDRASRLYQANLLWDWAWHGRLSEGVELTGYWDLGLGWWRWRKSTLPPDVSRNSFDFSLTPVFRLQSRSRTGIRPYLEGGAGVHALTNVRTFANRLSTSFEFGSHAGAGLSFGDTDIGYRFQHLSNAGIASPNTGVNAHIIHFVYRFR